MSDIVFPLSPARPARSGRLRRFVRRAVLLAVGGVVAYAAIARGVGPVQPAGWWQARFAEAAGRRTPVLEFSRDWRGRPTGTLTLSLEPGFDTRLPVANVTGTETSVLFTINDPSRPLRPGPSGLAPVGQNRG